MIATAAMPSTALRYTESYTPEIAERTAHLYERIKSVVPELLWPRYAPDIDAILRLKREKNAVILAHNYQTPEIFHAVRADSSASYGTQTVRWRIIGDSLALAREAARSDAEIIVQAGVHFMAETSKLLSPDKKVLIPDLRAGCSLADSITGADVRLLREKYPGVPVVTYVNTSAEVKAESDICCTSANAVKVVESLGVPRVIMIPDEFLAKNVAAQTNVEVITWAGHCEVHERFTVEDIERFRLLYPGVIVLAHPECPPEVVQASDFAGSTSGMINYVGEKRPARVVLITECSMSDNVAVQYPDVEFVRPCQRCPHMKQITLANIRHALETLTHEVTVDPELAPRARRAIERMLEVK